MTGGTKAPPYGKFPVVTQACHLCGEAACLLLKEKPWVL